MGKSMCKALHRHQLLVRPADWKIPRKNQTSVGPFASHSSVVRCSRLLVRSCSRLFVRQLGIPSRWLSHTGAPEHRWQEIKIKRSTRIRSNPFVVLVLRLLTILTLALKDKYWSVSKFRLSSARGGGFITKRCFSSKEGKIAPHYHRIVATGYEQETLSRQVLIDEVEWSGSLPSLDCYNY